MLVVGKKFIGMLSGVHCHASIRFDLFFEGRLHLEIIADGYTPSRNCRYRRSHLVEFARKPSPRLIYSSIWMGMRENAAPFHAKNFDPLSMLREPIIPSRGADKGIGIEERSLIWPIHGHTLPKSPLFLCETPPGCKRKNTDRDGGCPICAVGNNVPDRILERGRV